jgi:hypothetical protein
VSAVLLSTMEEAAVVTAREYPAEFFHLLHNGDGDSSSSRAHGQREGNPIISHIGRYSCYILQFVLTLRSFIFLQFGMLFIR